MPNSAIAKWVKTARQVVLIDGCFLRCHGRILENLLGKEQLLQFDALSHYKRYSDLFDPEDVPEAERQEVARDVADWVADWVARWGGRFAEPRAKLWSAFRQGTGRVLRDGNFLPIEYLW